MMEKINDHDALRIMTLKSRSCIVFIMLSISFLSFAEQDALGSIHNDIVSSYPSVAHINAEALITMTAESVVLFDVREKKEYAVSHLSGAIQIDPDLAANEFSSLYAKQLDGKTVVFYCSVGRRSSQFASRVGDVVKANGAQAFYSLEGGAFRWSNEQRPLMSSTIEGGESVTDKIHPYNWYWSRLIKNKDAIEY